MATVFDGHFPGTDFRQITDWFELGGSLQVDDTLSSRDLLARTSEVQGLHDSARTPAARSTRGARAGQAAEPELAASVDFVLEGLYAQRKISRSLEGQFQAAEQVKRPPRTVDPLTERELPLSGTKKKYYN